MTPCENLLKQECWIKRMQQSSAPPKNQDVSSLHPTSLLHVYISEGIKFVSILVGDIDISSCVVLFGQKSDGTGNACGMQLDIQTCFRKINI